MSGLALERSAALLLGTGDMGELIGENQQAGEQDVEFGMDQLGAHKLTSKIIRVSNELLQDSGINMENYLGGRIGNRLGRAEAHYLVKGTGAGTPTQPKGLETSVTGTVNTAAATKVTWQEINGLVHAVDPAYRRSSGYRLAFNDNTLKQIEEMGQANMKLFQNAMEMFTPFATAAQRSDLIRQTL